MIRICVLYLCLGILLFSEFNFHVVGAEGTLKKIIVLSRHGSREILTKSADDLSESSDPPLTATGKYELLKDGEYLNETYLLPLSISSIEHPQSVSFRTSALTRTFQSAQSLFYGLGSISISAREGNTQFAATIAPIFSVALAEDTLMRGWVHCPQITTNLNAFYKGQWFADNEKEHLAFFEKLLVEIKKIPNVENYPALADSVVNFKNSFNVYDTLWYLKSVEKLTFDEDMFNELELISSSLEFQKFSKEVVGSMGGGIFASMVKSNLETFLGKATGPKIEYYSGHYPGILSLFTALNIPQSNFNKKIPAYGSMVIFELYDNKGVFEVQMKFKDGVNVSANPISLDFIDNCSGNVCALSSFAKHIAAMDVTDNSKWCIECGNNSSDTCKASLYDEQNSRETSSCNDSCHEYAAGLIGAFVGLVAGAIGFFVAWWAVQRRSKEMANRHSKLKEQESYEISNL
eukprot:Nk52_evm15s252 gene=Nk52_evmTU15s252